MTESRMAKEELLGLILDHYSIQDHEIFAGPDWPDFESIKNRSQLPDFVTDELLQMYVLPEPPPIKPPRYVEFYITNVCNYGCSQCRSFNNFNFKGHYKFDLDLYSRWAKLVPLESFVILGGEPLLHPGLASWVRGTRSLWPNASAKIDTNGSYITKVKGLHQLLVDNRFFLCINIHATDLSAPLMHDINQCFGACEEISIASAMAHSNIGRGHAVSGRCFITSKGLLINIRPSAFFMGTVAGTTDWQKLSQSHTDLSAIYMGDAEKNHASCVSRYCATMIEGKFYKCATMATLPVFLQQKNLRWPHPLLDEYEPLTLENFSQEKIDHLYHTIPQCTFCKTEFSVDISSSVKKRNQHRTFQIQPAIGGP